MDRAYSEAALAPTFAVRFGHAVLFAAVGACAGVIAKIADESTWSWAGDLGTNRPLWVVIAVLIGWCARDALSAVVLSSCFFVAMVIAYYVYATAVLGHPLPQLAVGWLIAAVTVAPALSAITRILRDRVIGGAVWVGLCAAVVLSDGGVYRAWLWVTGQLGDGPGHVIEGCLELLLALMLLLLARTPRRVVIAAVACLILVIPLDGLADTVQTRLGLP